MSHFICLYVKHFDIYLKRLFSLARSLNRFGLFACYCFSTLDWWRTTTFVHSYCPVIFWLQVNFPLGDIQPGSLVSPKTYFHFVLFAKFSSVRTVRKCYACVVPFSIALNGILCRPLFNYNQLKFIDCVYVRFHFGSFGSFMGIHTLYEMCARIHINNGQLIQNIKCGMRRTNSTQERKRALAHALRWKWK